MNIIEHSWGPKSKVALRKAFDGCDSFLTCDPDANGALAFYSRGDVVACKSLADPQFFSWMEATVQARGYRGVSRLVLVMETQFMKVNIMSTVTMARRAGYIAGALAMCSRTGIALVNVAPATWQNPLGSAQGIAPGQMDREKRKQLAFTLCAPIAEKIVPGWHGHSSEQQQGIADTLGIGQWWRNVCAGVLR